LLSQPIKPFVEPNLTRSVKWAQTTLMDRRTSDRIAFVRFDITDWRGLMSTLEAEKDVKNTVQATEAVEIIDCGRASDRTRGVSFLILFEQGSAPYNKLLFL